MRTARERIVARTADARAETRIRLVFGGGSSRMRSRAFWAWGFIHSAPATIATRRPPSFAPSRSAVWIRRIWAILMRVSLAPRSTQKRSG